MWTTVYVATSLEQATEIEKQLKEEGFLVKTQLFSTEEDEKLYEILAPEIEAMDIQIVLYNLGIL